MATNEGRIVTKFSKNKTGAKLLPEALAADLHVLEDEDMIRSLGRDKFVQLSIHGSQGWQEGVSKPSHKLFCCFWVLHSRGLGSAFQGFGFYVFKHTITSWCRIRALSRRSKFFLFFYSGCACFKTTNHSAQNIHSLCIFTLTHYFVCAQLP